MPATIADMKLLTSLLLLCGSLWWGPLSSAHAAESTALPKVFSAELIGTYTPERLTQITDKELQVFLTGSTRGFEHFKGKFAPPKYALKLYRLKYLSVVPELGQRSMVASGLGAKATP